MGRSVIMEIMPEILESFTKAIQDPENTENGLLNWNFVDADCYMDLCRSDWSAEENKDFYEQFDYLAFTYNNSNTESYLSS
jgi:hypothetical protein